MAEQEFGEDVRFIGVAGQDDAEEIATFVDEFELGGFEHIFDPSGEVWNVFGITGQPSYVFINDDGAISRQIGALEPDAFAEVLQQLATT